MTIFPHCRTQQQERWSSCRCLDKEAQDSAGVPGFFGTLYNWVSSWALVLLFCASGGAFAQQDYAGNVTDCSTGRSVGVGYTCSDDRTACQTRAYYRAQPSQTLAEVATLFATSTSAVGSANQLPITTSDLSPNQPLLIPLSCNCSSLSYSSAEIAYAVQPDDTMYSVANSTYQGLTTCGAINASNPSPTAMDSGSTLTIPLRCACPSKAQVSSGINFLVTYPIVLGDDLDTVGSAFGADAALFRAANNLSQSSAIYPQTTVLIPLTELPSSAPSVGASSSSTGHRSKQVGKYVGIAIGGAAVVLGLLLMGFFIHRKRSHRSASHLPPSEEELMQEPELPPPVEDDRNRTQPWTCSTAEIAQATKYFDAGNLIKGSVYRGELRRRNVAIKRIDWDMSGEKAVLEQLDHLRIIPLWGYCQDPVRDSFLVFPLIGERSLEGWLHEPPGTGSSPCLDWAARVRIATDIANALAYLHNDETKPKFLHRNISSSNVLVDEGFRGKLSNFRMAEKMDQGRMQASYAEGTLGYVAPECVSEGSLSSKTDVFAFGVVLLEMLSGKPAAHVRGGDGEGCSRQPGRNVVLLWELASTVRPENLHRWMDLKLKEPYPNKCAQRMLSLAQQCVAHDPRARPGMFRAHADLQEIMEATEKSEHSGTSDR